MPTMTYLQAISDGLREEMRDDERVFCMGEDIGVFGGAFKVTDGFIDEFGPDRVMDTPLAESGIVGTAVGAAVVGLRPVCEMQFSDFISCGFDQLVNVAGKMHYRQGLAVPITVRLPTGGGFSGGPFHSQNPEAWFLRTPGLKVACPATAEDAGLLLGAAIADPNPVLFFEQKSLYTRVKGEFTYDSSAPLSGAAVRRPGSDVTIVSYGATLHLALTAAEGLADEGIDCEVVDLRVLCPLDFDTVAASVEKTGRCVIAHEDYPDYGVAAELAARLAGELFRALDAPVGRVGARFWPIPFSPPLEQATLPTAEGIAEAVRELARF